MEVGRRRRRIEEQAGDRRWMIQCECFLSPPEAGVRGGAASKMNSCLPPRK